MKGRELTEDEKDSMSCIVKNTNALKMYVCEICSDEYPSLPENAEGYCGVCAIKMKLD